ncbi:LysR substrate-binding domain-containing protein [Cupriavidus sp. CV2]|uniref:LysR family transcriptional regulator n=1 Tax=Cupriavidus ulmosensis TaxID=3065913 RepID=UPI00296AA9B0|nr:LysR substrate-binding domain-containing protein [Cupriavidus sp. CV2]MDW3685995.1 LysR substrate-binding domain-containing protein [Cupriavidus sp. CV2]
MSVKSAKLAQVVEKKGATSGVFDDLVSLRIFARVVELESFSNAALRLDVTPATVSKHISALEARAGTRLVNRTTRRVAITEAGHRLYDHCQRVLAEIEEAEAGLSEFRSEPAGHIRITAPTVLAVHFIAPYLPEFLQRYPRISVDLNLDIRKTDLHHERIDVAIRITDAVEPGLVAIRLAPSRRVFCAAPRYLKTHGKPGSPQDLAGHNCLVLRSLALGDNWPVRQGEEISQIRVSGNLIADNGEVIRAAACAGTGIAMLPHWLVKEDIRADRLQEILPEHAVENITIFAVLPHRGFVSPKARCFVDFLKEKWRDFS